MIRIVLLVALLSPLASCLRSTQFQCETSDQCGTGNTCESTGYCSFADSDCQRYTDSAGPLAGQCVSGGGSNDAGIDAPPIGDDAAGGCPIGYEDLPGVANGHKYRLITATDDWNQQRTACTRTTSSAYLAIPDDQTELTALSVKAQQQPYWIGVGDLQTEGMYVTVKSTPQTFLPWAPGEPDNDGPGEEDCVLTLAANSQFDDVRCTRQFRAICECEP